MRKFTRGKWILKNNSIQAYSEDGKWIDYIADMLSCLPDTDGDDARERAVEEEAANVRLITSAPEMYDLLERVAYGNCNDCLPLMVAAREILARIDGKESSTENV